MSNITPNNNTVEQGIDRLVEQWRNKPNLNAVIEAIIGGSQELEDTFHALDKERMDLENTVGQQLDNYGTIVGQERLNFDDDFYRILLNARIGINVSEGEPERIISTAKKLTKAAFVHYMNLNKYEIAIGSDGIINPLSVEFLIQNLQRATMGSVRVNYLAIYDGEDSFSFDGTNTKTIGKGFGSIYDLNAGGKMAQLHNVKKSFSFSGNNTSDQGFGSIHDPLAGGVFVTDII